jgi:hypothetical protein
MQTKSVVICQTSTSWILNRLGFIKQPVVLGVSHEPGVGRHLGASAAMCVVHQPGESRWAAPIYGCHPWLLRTRVADSPDGRTGCPAEYRDEPHPLGGQQSDHVARRRGFPRHPPPATRALPRLPRRDSHAHGHCSENGRWSRPAATRELECDTGARYFAA